jgi:hypothetical protein
MPGLAPLVLIVLALGILFGLTKPRRLGKFFVGLLVGPVLIGIVFVAGREILANLPPGQRILFIVVGAVVALIILMRVVLPREFQAALAADFVYDILKFIVFLPFRILGFIFRLFVRGGAR